MPNPLTTWNPVVTRGLSFVRQFRLTNAAGEPVVQFAGSEWRITFYQPGGTLIYQTVPGDWAEVSDDARIMTLDTNTTDMFTAGNFTYDFDVVGSETWRLVSDGRGIAKEDS